MPIKLPHAVIIGAGVSGLAAAHALRERNYIRITTIELNSKWGGSLRGARLIGGIVVDFGRVGTLDDPNDELWDEIGLEDELIPIDMHEPGDWVMFRHSQASVVRALKPQLEELLLLRSAVTSIGEFDANARAHGFPRFCLCLENGTVLEADAVIIAVPAPRAERILRSLSPAAAAQLVNYRFDSILRVNIVHYTQDIDRDLRGMRVGGKPITYVVRVDHPIRVPDGMTWHQFGLRYDPTAGDPEWENRGISEQIATLFDLRVAPKIRPHLFAWPFDEPLEWRDAGFAARMEALHHALPDGVAVAGSDYVVTDKRPTIADRIRSGFAAADRVYPALI